MYIDFKNISKRRDAQVAELTKLVTKKYPDSRSFIGMKYMYEQMVSALFTAMSAGMRSMRAIHEFMHTNKCLPIFGESDRPSYNCVRDFLIRWDGTKLLNSIETYLTRDMPFGVAIDGKTSRRAKRRGDRTGTQFLNITTHDGVIIGQIQIPEKTNEIPEARKAIKERENCLKNKILTFDALHTQQWLASTISSIEAYYLFIVKDNQPTLLRECKYFIDALSIGTHTTIDKGHGRLETRTITLATAPATISRLWRNCSYIFRIETLREDCISGEIETDVHFGITNLSKEYATPENILALKRGHWSVENKIHYVLDELYTEDRCRCRTETLAGVMSALRKIGIAILRGVGKGKPLTSVARALALN